MARTTHQLLNHCQPMCCCCPSPPAAPPLQPSGWLMRSDACAAPWQPAHEARAAPPRRGTQQRHPPAPPWAPQPPRCRSRPQTAHWNRRRADQHNKHVRQLAEHQHTGPSQPSAGCSSLGEIMCCCWSICTARRSDEVQLMSPTAAACPATASLAVTLLSTALQRRRPPHRWRHLHHPVAHPVGGAGHQLRVLPARCEVQPPPPYVQPAVRLPLGHTAGHALPRQH